MAVGGSLSTKSVSDCPVILRRFPVSFRMMFDEHYEVWQLITTVQKIVTGSPDSSEHMIIWDYRP